MQAHHPFPEEFEVSGPGTDVRLPSTGIERVPITPMTLLQVAMNQNADLDRLEKLMELQFRWEAAEAKKKYDAAVAAFKANPPEILKNRHVDYTTKQGNRVQYDHATLDQVCSAVTESLSKHGITHRWTVAQSEGLIRVTCILTCAGHSEQTTLSSGPDDSGGKNAIQAIASAMKYLQRYTLLAATGLEAGNGDNDGQGGPPMETLKMHLDRIAGAVNLTVLEKAYKDAFMEAKNVNNSPAMVAIVKAKDKRKEQLTKDEAA
jgi:hypothetical protein